MTGVDLYSAGDFIGVEGSEDLVLRDARRGVYKRLVLQDGCLVGAVLYGDVQDGPWYFDMIQRRTPVGALRQRLLFGKAQCEALAA
ncbi:nitrite reductase [NAD(P)H], large subunit [compost metagenome]